MEEERGFEPLRAFTLLSVSRPIPSAGLGYSSLINGGLCRTRTCDPLINSQMLLPTELLWNNKSNALALDLKKPGNVLVSQGVSPTTFDAKELNFCVRYGYRCVLFAIATRRKLHTSIISSFIPLSTSLPKELHLIKSSTY